LIFGEGPPVLVLDADAGFAELFRPAGFFAERFIGKPVATRAVRLPCLGEHILKFLFAFRKGCKPMMACTFFATSDGMLGAF
jgi:hypothetical protein